MQTPDQISDSSAVTVSSGATYDLNNLSDSIGSLAGAGSVTLGTATLTAGGDNTSTTFSGIVSETGNLVKEGTGTLTLSNANTYSGTTTITGGTLELNNGSGESIDNSSQINLTGGTLLLAASDQIDDATNMNLNGGTFSTAGFDESLATLTLNATSTIDVGAGGSIINYTSGTYSAGQLNVTSWAGSFSGGGSDQIIFGSSLTQTFLDNVVWTDQGITGAFQLPSGEIVPIPEPATIFSGALLIGLIGIDFYRRRKKSKGSELIDPES